MRLASTSTNGSIATTLARIALLLVVAGTARAETADELALRDQAAGNNLPVVQELLAKGTSPNVPDHNGRTAVHHGANIAKAAILEALLQAGGDPDAKDAAGSTPLHLAAAFPYFEPDSQLSVRVLLNYGGDPGVADREGRTPLHLAAGNHEEAASIRDLLSSGADANAADHRGDTPLHTAVGRSGKFSADVVAGLVDGGARGDAVGGSGETALQLFVRVGSDNGWIVEALVAGGADPDGKNPEGETPLHTAVRNGGSSENPKVVEALLAAGADPCIKDGSGYIPYNTAREGGDVHTMLANAGGSDFSCDGQEATAELDADLVRRIQSALASKGYDPGPIDGVMGGGTRSAISAWQDATGFPATGELTGEEVDMLIAEVPSVDVGADPPSPLCSGSGEEEGCWLEVADRDGCWLWKLWKRPEEMVTWSGSCPGGRASGAGTETSTFRNWEGGWTTRTGEGAYLDDTRHGPWTFRWDEGHVLEGSYVDGEREGRWIGRMADGGATEITYKNGKRHGHYVHRYSNGSLEEGSYVDGKAHGHWVFRSPDGHCQTTEWSDGEIVSSGEEC